MQRELDAAIAAHLHENAQVLPGDVFIFTHENDDSDWSVEGGKFAMVMAQQAGPGAA